MFKWNSPPAWCLRLPSSFLTPARLNSRVVTCTITQPRSGRTSKSRIGLVVTVSHHILQWHRNSISTWQKKHIEIVLLKQFVGVFFFHWLSIKTPHMCSFLTHLIFHCLAPGDVPCSCAQQVWKAPRRAFYLDSTLQTCLVFTGPNSYTGYKEASLFSVNRIMAQH